MAIANNYKEIIFEFQKTIPVKIGELARAFDLEAYRVDDMKEGISGAIVKEGNSYTIYTNSNEPLKRRRFTVAHELAHFILHKHLIDNDLNGNLTEAKSGIMYRSKLSNIYERQANQLASEILIPIDALKKKLDETKNIIELADLFDVSKEAMKIRLKPLVNKYLV